MKPEAVTGLILAGGRGRRLGGMDKGLALFRGRPLTGWVIDRLAAQVGPLIINANRNIPQYRHFGYPVVSDKISGFYGPLAGIDAGLQAALTPYLLVVPCDGPHLPSDLVQRLAAAAMRDDMPLAVCSDGRRLHPAYALLRVALLRDGVRRFLERGERRLLDWVSATPHVVVDYADCPAAFANLNTPQDLQRWEEGKGRA